MLSYVMPFDAASTSNMKAPGIFSVERSRARVIGVPGTLSRAFERALA